MNSQTYLSFSTFFWFYLFGGFGNRCNSYIVLSLATALEAGAFASCIVLKSLLPFLMDVARGFPYYLSIGASTTEYSTRQDVLFGLIWIASTLLVGAAMVYREGNFRNINLISIINFQIY